MTFTLDKRARSLAARREVRFLFAGALNTAFGFAVYTAFALTPLPTWLVVLSTQVFAIAFSFVTNGGLVFRSLSSRALPRFVLVYLFIAALYAILIDALSPSVGGRIAAMAIVMIPVVALTYALQARFVFRKSGLAPAAASRL